MTSNEAYKRLGISRDANEKQIKRAFRQKARKYHSDTSGRDDGYELSKLIEARELLLSKRNYSSISTYSTNSVGTKFYVDHTTTKHRPYQHYRSTKKKEPITDTSSCFELIAIVIGFLSLFISQCN